jgi:DNA-binding transcriptional MerR regulator
MTMSDPKRLSIGEVSERTGLSRHTLRFYEQQGLFIEPIARDSAGRRVFKEDEVEWLLVCAKLRATGMPLSDIHHYAELVRQGPGTEAARFETLRAHEARMQAQLADLQELLKVFQNKVAYYADRLAASTAANTLWHNAP